MQNEQEQIVTTPAESADNGGFEIVKTEPLSEQDALQGYSWECQIKIDPSIIPSEVKKAILDGTFESTDEGTLLTTEGSIDSKLTDPPTGMERHPLNHGNMEFNPASVENLEIQRTGQVKPLDDSEYQARKEQLANAAGNEVQKYTRARGNEALVVNKFVLDGTSYPGDVVVGWAERHTPIRWCDPKDVDTNQIGYLPCKPALKTTNPIPGIVAIRRKNGKLVILCGFIADLRIPFKAHVFNENQLTKGKLAESLQLAKLWDNGGMQLQKTASDAASILNLKNNKA